MQTAFANPEKERPSLIEASIGGVTGALAAGMDSAVPNIWWLTWELEERLRISYLIPTRVNSTYKFARIFSNLAYYFTYNHLNTAEDRLEKQRYFFLAFVRFLIF